MLTLLLDVSVAKTPTHAQPDRATGTCSHTLVTGLVPYIVSISALTRSGGEVCMHLQSRLSVPHKWGIRTFSLLPRGSWTRTADAPSIAFRSALDSFNISARSTGGGCATIADTAHS